MKNSCRRKSSEETLLCAFLCCPGYFIGQSWKELYPGVEGPVGSVCISK